MRKQLALLIPTAAALSVLAAPAAADRRPHNGSAEAHGRVQFTVSAGQDERMSFFAVDRGVAARDRGFIQYQNATAGFKYHARLDCVAITGHSAKFGYVIPDREKVPAAIRGMGVVFQVDNGNSGTAKDMVGYVTGAATIAAACDTTAVPTLKPVTAGDIVVRPKKEDKPRPKPKPKPKVDDDDDDDDKARKGKADDDTDDTDDTEDSEDTDD